jgi:hypothetical protein
MAETADAANHWGVRSRRLAVTSGTVVIAALMAAGATAIGGSRAAPASFKLVFDGKHNAALLHEGTFTSSVVACPSGSAADVSLDSDTESALRRFTCAGAKAEFTARVAPLPAEHGGLGSWQIVAGTGPLANLRGKGTWTSTRLAGRPDDPATIVFRSTWDGVADFDVTAPTVAVSGVAVRKLRRPKGTYRLRVVLSLSDAEGGVVSYRLEVVDPRKPLNLLGWKKGETAATSIATVRVHPTKTTRILQLKIAASDAVGNDTTFTKTVRLK